MAVVASLDVVLGATVDKFSKGLQKGRNELKTFAKSVTSTSGLIDTAFSAKGAAVAGVAIMGKLFRTTADDISRLADVSSKLGIDPTVLRAFESAAARTGVTTQQLEMGLQRMTRRLSEAARGTGEAQNALQELGLSAKTLTSLSPDQAFKTLADAINAVENPADRVRLAFKLFDSEGVNLVRTMGLGSKGLEKLEDQLRAVGGTIDGGTIQSIKNFEIALEDLKLAASGPTIAVMRELSGNITAVTSTLSSVTNVAPRASQAFSGLMNVVSASPIERLKTLADFWKNLGSVLVGNTDGFRQAGQSLKDFVFGVEQATPALNSMSQSTRQAAAGIEDLSKVTEEFERVSRETEELTTSWLDDMNTKLATLEDRFRKPLTPLQQMQQDARTINDLFAAGLVTLERRNQLLTASFADTVGAAAVDRTRRVEAEMARRRERQRSAELSLIERRKGALEDELSRRTAAIRSEADLTPASIERGTAEAFSAFNRARKQKDASDKIAQHTAKTNEILNRLEKRAAFLKKAPI